MAAPKRRARGEGTVYFDEERGRWIAAVKIDGRRRKVSAKDKTEARAKLAQLLAAKHTGAAVPDRSVTVARALDDFLTRALPNRTSGRRPLSPTTIERHHASAAHIRRELGAVRLAELTVVSIDNMLDRLTAGCGARRPLGRASQQKILQTLALTLDYAKRRKLIAENVAREATIPPAAKPTTPRTSLRPDQARALLDELHLERNGAMFAMSLMLGLRPGEAAGLFWEDLHLDEGLVNVTRGLRVVRNRTEVADDLKTESSKRTVAMPADLVDWLRRHRTEQAAERLRSTEWRDPRLVFATRTGRPLSPSNNRRQLSAICERLGIAAVTPNELRHSCASLLADEGVSNEAIADLLGHTTTRMVDQTYRHRLRPFIDVAASPFWLSTLTE